MSATPPPAASSPPRSMVGYSVRTWLRRNKDQLKLLVAALAAYGTARFAAIPEDALRLLVAAGVGVLSRMALDAVDYWLSDVKP